jgi:nitrogen fixation protein
MITASRSDLVTAIVKQDLEGHLRKVKRFSVWGGRVKVPSGYYFEFSRVCQKETGHCEES